ncbi:MAG: sodium:alanine symporter family protein [Alloprevotella sp.]|nr:sodium:alanine symporter family protein [Alloprevotella sp.]
MSISEFLAKLSDLLWGWPMIVLLLGTHIYLTILLRAPQRKVFKAIRISLQRDKDAKGDVSQFGALATALAATIGTGNIVGVAIAVSMGGPGAVFWCWICGVFGMATKYAEGLLAVKYRVRTADGRMLGGPMYALEKGLNMKWLAILFALFTAVAALGIGCSVQSNAIAMLFEQNYSINHWIVGIATGLLTGAVILGGIRSIAKVCSTLVPFMALIYVLGCFVILIINSAYILPALKLIVTSAFNGQAAGGGFVGATVMMAAGYGIARGLFSNESGLGSAPIIAAAAKTKNPVRQALVSSTATFWDTVVICAITGLVLVSTIISEPDASKLEGAILTHVAFSRIPLIGPHILSLGIVTFALSTILGWSYYGERAMEYLGGRRSTKIYSIVYIIFVILGSGINLTLVWNMADCMNALMAIPNLISLLLLSGVLVSETRKYLWQGNIEMDDESLETDS